MNKKIRYTLAGVFIILLASLAWVAFKPYHYAIQFQSKTLPGVINQTIKVWSINLKGSDVEESPSVNLIKQRIKTKNTTYFYNWELTQKSDSLTKVRVEVIDSTQNNLLARLSNVFQKEKIKKTSVENVKALLEILNEHLEDHEVVIDEQTASPSVFCAYVPLKGIQPQKAKGMMLHYNLISDFILKHGIETNGNPMVEVYNWEMEKDSIHYNFCFPIIMKDSLPEDPLIKYKQIDSKNALKATYYGNYMSSDRAWYALQSYAENNSIDLENTPIEVFHNNPMQGGDDTKWKTEVYLPIKDK
ncbi:GyrI-like domain-containing protein [Psychroflexus sp. CAK8W]|uniref:GyrI-like domain-containing protein n=1 Tax=Psychroflexus longus TaxID=2873596 RepID=A0ABS7XI35_9FLAO|nr:GyrI-like domain-containing protein [Psychroflexus longus]MBZ9778617.1 GyrI-like domain-containing protein [Psychroflexus longus]